MCEKKKVVSIEARKQKEKKMKTKNDDGNVCGDAKKGKVQKICSQLMTYFCFVSFWLI